MENSGGPDLKVHQNKHHSYYAGVVGLWDTYRAAVPLLEIVKPDIANEYVQTFLEHYKYAGQLPIWTLASNETYQMLGLHSLPVITDCYKKGIRGFDAEKAFEAMKVTAMKDTTGFSMRCFVGLKNYKKIRIYSSRFRSGSNRSNTRVCL
ncbi:MAG: glycoside hydrolase family 92 protein [Bacteroidales bacterium]|nr:glycoside hydrolase family 92 protein [Bacteroidales bacterium]